MHIGNKPRSELENCVFIGILLLGVIGIFLVASEDNPKPIDGEFKIVRMAKKWGIPNDQIEKMKETNCLKSNINYLKYGEHTDRWCYDNYKNLDIYKK